VRKDRQEVRIPVPAWNEMHMEVPGDTGSCGSSEVDPKVKAMGAYRAAQALHHRLEHPQHFVPLRFCERTQRPYVAVRRDHEVPVIIRVAIEQREDLFASCDDLVLPVGARAFGRTENAASRLWRCDELVSPWGPETF